MATCLPTALRWPSCPAEPDNLRKNGYNFISAAHRKHGIHIDPSGRSACLYTRGLLMGLQVGISVAVKERDNARDCASTQANATYNALM